MFKSGNNGERDMGKNKYVANIKLDTNSGSLAYNRLDMQVSQTLHMAIELYDSLDYLFVLDYYDDITLFDDANNPEIVSYYQMKTHDESISISTAISDDWLSKLYARLEQSEWMVKELGLITNCPLKITFIDEEQKQRTKSYKAEKTLFSEFNINTINKIKEDIAKKNNKTIDEVDLSKFVHMRTTLSIPKHTDLVEKEMGDFLGEKYPRITLDVVKAIYSSMVTILTNKQKYELLSENAELDVVRKKKGITKNDFLRVIDEAMIISIPEFEDVFLVGEFGKDEKNQVSLEYVRLLSDAHAKKETFISIFKKAQNVCKQQKICSEESKLDYINRLSNIIYDKKSIMSSIYNYMYIKVMILCILINEERRS